MKPILTFFLVIATTAVCQAGFMINLGGSETSGSGAGSIADDAVVLNFEDFAADKVKLTITARLTVPPEYVWGKATDFWFNSSVAISSFAHDSGVMAVGTTYSAGGIGGFGSGMTFNNKIEFSAGGPSGAFFPGKFSSYILMGTGLTESSFNVTSTNGGSLTLLAGMHINDPDSGPNSGKYGNTTSAVPEPASLAMWSLGGLGMMFARRKRQKKLAA